MSVEDHVNVTWNTEASWESAGDSVRVANFRASVEGQSPFGGLIDAPCGKHTSFF